jgi:hypothetical protein
MLGTWPAARTAWNNAVRNVQLKKKTELFNKALWLLRIPPALTFKENEKFMLFKLLTISGDYFPKQH